MKKQDLSIPYLCMLAAEILLPVIWIKYDSHVARAIWVGMITFFTFLTFAMLILRALVLKTQSHFAEGFKFNPKSLSWPKQIFHLFLNGAFAYIMVVYAGHPLLGALIIVAYFALFYEVMFNNG